MPSKSARERAIAKALQEKDAAINDLRLKLHEKALNIEANKKVCLSIVRICFWTERLSS